MNELATIAERVWKVCPECRPERLWFVKNTGLMLDAEGWGDGSGIVCASDIAELLIIGACVKYVDSLGCTLLFSSESFTVSTHRANESVKYHAGPTRAISLLLACEQLALKEPTNG